MSHLRALLLCLLFALVAVAGAMPVSAQQSSSLFESLFGSGAEQGSQPADSPQVVTPAPAPQPDPSPPPAGDVDTPEAAPPPEVPAAETPVTEPAPAETTPVEGAPILTAAPSTGPARRIAVFGDSLAIDLASALERFYANNPAVVVLDQGVGSSGFVRDDFFDWNAAIDEAIAEDSFDVAVIMIGINDRQELGGNTPLSEPWRQSYSARVTAALESLDAAGKPVVWLELPPMERNSFSADVAQISSLQRMAVFAEGGEWVETYERFSAESGGYSATGPDLNGNIVPMRKSDGIHFSSAGADKLAFYVDRALRGAGAGNAAPASSGGFAITVTDLIASSEAGGLLRPPFQGLGQESLALADGSVQQLSSEAARASTLLVAGSVPADPGFTLEDMMTAPPDRVDSFGLVTMPAELPGGR